MSDTPASASITLPDVQVSGVTPDYSAAPRIYVEIFPHEGGAYAIEGGKDQVLHCSVSKSMKAPAGHFEIMLAPGGPNGPNVGPSWLDIITPMSFVKIGMTRGQFRNIVMLGVVTSMEESWSFMTKPVRRTVKVIGQDLGYFFTHFSWYALTFINGPAAAIGIQIGNEAAGGALGTVAGLGGNLTQGSPDEIGAAWYTGVMDGPKGILSKTWFDNALNSEILFSDAVAVQFEKFSDNVKVPWTFSYVSAEETWWDKFTKIFPFPFYEFFTMTAPDGFYGQALTTSWNSVSGGSTFSMGKLPDVKVKMNVVARVNPLPVLKATGSSNSLTFNGIDTTAWNNLRTFPEDIRLITTTEEFNEREVRNFFVINPIYMKSLLGQANNAVTPPMLGVNVAVDPASIHRYGFRPVYMETEWFADSTGQVAQSQAGAQASAQGGQSDNFQQLFAHLTARLASQYEPVSLMMCAERSGPLRPDIIPGNRFTYQPLKDKITKPWTFYIEGIHHRYTFGGQSMTLLQLTRGLPSDVYGDTGLLEALHKGVAQRLNGEYQLGLPSSSFESEVGLEGVSLIPEQVQKVLNDLAPIYSTAKGGQTPQQ